MKIKDKYYYNKKTITQLINDDGKYSAFELNCYPYNVDRDIDTFFQRILETLKNKGKKYIFTYYPELNLMIFYMPRVLNQKKL